MTYYQALIYQNGVVVNAHTTMTMESAEYWGRTLKDGQTLIIEQTSALYW